MKKGDSVKATWSDGLVLVGKYVTSERGYIIIKDSEGNSIACNPSSVEFEILRSFTASKEKNEYCDCCECDPCDCDWGNC